MWLLQARVTLGLFLVSSVFAQHTFYVKPNDLQECPGQPLDLYAEEADIFFTTGATFLLLAGNHTIQTVITLTNASGITLQRYDDESTVTILCRATILNCNTVSNLTINGLTIEHLFSSNSQEFSAFIFYYSTGIQIFNSKFQGSGKLTETGIRAVYSDRSVVIIVNCLFDGNKGYNGGALYASRSNITLTGNIFTQNKARSHGGAIFAYSSYLNFDN